MDWGPVVFSLITGAVGKELVASLFKLVRRKPVERPSLFVNGEKEQIIRQVNSLVIGQREADRQFEEMRGDLADIRRHLSGRSTWPQLPPGSSQSQTA